MRLKKTTWITPLGVGFFVTASYYRDNLKATQIDALSPPG